MSSFFETSPAKTYFNELERWFIDLRGAPQKLSVDDYQVAKAWYQAGIPLDLVRTQITEIVDRRKKTGSEVQTRLRYYCKPVEKAFEERERLQAPGRDVDEPSLDLTNRLGRLAAALPSEPWAQSFVGRIQELQGDAETLESQLAALEEEMLQAGEAALEGPARQAFEERLSEAVGKLEDRMPGGVSEPVQQRLRRQILGRFLDLPEMSLFGVEASQGEP